MSPSLPPVHQKVNFWLHTPTARYSSTVSDLVVSRSGRFCDEIRGQAIPRL